VPVPDPVVEEKRHRVILKGDVPSPVNPPKGCNFCDRCPVALKLCHSEEPAFQEVQPGHWVACHRVV
jgi:oligopeptide/dipeptide ABC transporter ATP-binding protein